MSLFHNSFMWEKAVSCAQFARRHGEIADANFNCFGAHRKDELEESRGRIEIYLEDVNGNGLVDSGEPSWLLNAYNGLSVGAGLRVFTPLK